MVPTCIVAAREHNLSRSLKRVMEPAFEVVATIDNVVSLSIAIGSLDPSVVVVDFDLLGPDADRVLGTLRDRFPSTPLIGLIADDDETARGADFGFTAVLVPEGKTSSGLISETANCDGS